MCVCSGLFATARCIDLQARRPRLVDLPRVPRPRSPADPFSLEASAHEVARGAPMGLGCRSIVCALMRRNRKLDGPKGAERGAMDGNLERARVEAPPLFSRIVGESPDTDARTWRKGPVRRAVY